MPPQCGGIVQRNPGGVLLSQGATPQVPSAQAGLTSVFGMGTGVTPPLWPPEHLLSMVREHLELSIASTSEFDPSPRPISTGQLNALLRLHFRPINVVVWPRALPGYPVGDLI